MSRTLVSALMTLLVVAALAPGAIGGVLADDVTLTVTVVDSNGNSVGDVDLTATWDDGNGGPVTETTTPDGRALFGVPEGADVQIRIEDDQYMRNFPYEISDVSDQTEQMPVSLSGTATVTVEESGSPVRNAEVSLVDDQGREVTDDQLTDQNGVATTNPVERESYALEVRKPGYITNETDLTVDGDVSKTVAIERGNVIVDFTITDETFETPQPVENVTVDIRNDATLVTSSDGTTVTDLAVNREYDITAQKDGYDPVTETLDIGEDPTSLDISIRRTDDINVRASNDRVVVGEPTQITVTDEYGNLVEGATVSIGGTTVGQTDANGQLSVPINSTGNVSIDVEDSGLSASVSVESFQPSSNDSTPTATATATVTQTVTSTPNATATETPAGTGPGFGVVAALLALTGLLVASRR